MIVAIDNLGAVGAGKLFRFFADAVAYIRRTSPAAVGADFADSTTVFAEMPVNTFEVAIAFTRVDFHVVTVLLQRYS